MVGSKGFGLGGRVQCACSFTFQGLGIWASQWSGVLVWGLGFRGRRYGQDMIPSNPYSTILWDVLPSTNSPE